MKNQINRGNTCDISGCIKLARVKGLCMNCYKRNKIKNKKELIIKILAMKL